MQEDVLGPLKEVNGDRKRKYTTCSRCSRSLLRDEAKPGPLPKFAPSDEKVAEREELCPPCYEDFMRGELLPVEDEER